MTDKMKFGEIGGEDALHRILRSLQNRKSSVYREVDSPNFAQIGMVLRALADHTSLMQAVKWNHDPKGFWPEATSVGQWLLAYSDYCEEKWLMNRVD